MDWKQYNSRMDSSPFVITPSTFDWHYQKYLLKQTRRWEQFLVHAYQEHVCYVSSPDKKIQLGLISRNWDTKTFGLKVGELLIWDNSQTESIFPYMQKILRIASKAKYQLITCRLAYDNFKNIRALQQNSFSLVDCMNIYLFNKAKEKFPPVKTHTDIFLEQVQVAALSERSVRSITEIAKSSFINSRIHNDANFTIKQFEHYAVQMATSLLQNQAATCIVAKQNNKIIGFAIGNEDDTCKTILPNQLGYLWLIAVDQAFRGKNIGLQLLNNFIQAMSQEVELIEIGTQINNYPALSLYNTPYLKVSSSLATFHLWILV